MLGCLRIGTRNEHAPVREVSECVPHLLPIHHPFVAVAHGARRESGKVGTGTRLAEQLTPLLFAGEHRPQEASLHLVAAVRDDRRAGEGEEEGGRVGACGTCGAHSRLDELVELGSQPEATEADREVHPREARVVSCAAKDDVVGVAGIVRGEQLGDCRLDLGDVGIHPFILVDGR